MKNKIKNILNIVIFILFIIITFYIIFKDKDIFEIINNIKKVKLQYIILGISFMCVFVLCEAISIRRVLISLGNKVSFINAIKYAAVGFFASSITPSSSGGDPAQLYFMSKDNLKVSHSALALLVELCSFQLITFILAIIGFIVNYDILINHIGNIKYLMFLGITINLIILISLIVMIFSKKIALYIIKVIYKILELVHYKKRNIFLKKAISQVEEYHKCSIYLKNNKSIFIKTFITSLIQLVLYHSIPYLIFLAFNLQGYSFITFVFMESVLYISVSSLPFPGAVGISEGSFLTMFKMFFPKNILSSAMLISRGISFYLFVIITGLLILGFKIYESLIIRKNNY